MIGISTTGWNTSGLNNIGNAFNGGNNGIAYFTSFDFSNLDFSNLTSTYYTFENCKYLESITFPDDVGSTSGMNNFINMFSVCEALASLDLSNFTISTSSCWGSQGLFSECMKLRSLDLTGWNTSALTDFNEWFGNPYTDKQLDFLGSITWPSTFDMSSASGQSDGCHLNLSTTAISKDNVVTLFNALANTSGETKTIGIRNTTYDQLSAAEIAIATAKNFAITSLKSFDTWSTWESRLNGGRWNYAWDMNGPDFRDTHGSFSHFTSTMSGSSGTITFYLDDTQLFTGTLTKLTDHGLQVDITYNGTAETWYLALGQNDTGSSTQLRLFNDHHSWCRFNYNE